jgi:hypothetical protein
VTANNAEGIMFQSAGAKILWTFKNKIATFLYRWIRTLSGYRSYDSARGREVSHAHVLHIGGAPRL